jgi:hypothetical protein
MATPMSAWRSAGAIVDAVAGHRHHGAVGAQRAHQAQLVLRRHPRIDVVGARQLAQLRLVEAVQVGTGGDGTVGEPQRRADRRGGPRVVAGDHQHAHAGATARRDRFERLWPRRVEHPLQPQHLQLAQRTLDVLRRHVRARGKRSTRCPRAVSRSTSRRTAAGSAPTQCGSRTSGAPLT